jgi:peptidoglycan/xylan/chitin deacetylase (PgdA/CDA1 family)
MSPKQRVIQLLKWLVALALHVTGCLAWLRRRRARRGEIPILWLHRVAGSPDARLPMALPPGAFERLVGALARRYRIAPFAACVDAARARSALPHAAITFDDGYSDNAEIAWPILRRAGANAIFCLSVGFIDGAPLWWDVVAAKHGSEGRDRFPLDPKGEARYGAKADAAIRTFKTLPNGERAARIQAIGGVDASRLPRALRWDEARRMVDEGAEVAGHGVTHAILTRCTDDELAGEVGGCRSVLRERLGLEVDLFAYPNGDHDERVAAALRRAGFRYAFTTERGFYTAETDPMRIPRIGVSEPRYSLDGKSFSWALFEAEMLGVFDVLLRRRSRRARAADAAKAPGRPLVPDAGGDLDGDPTRG